MSLFPLFQEEFPSDFRLPHYPFLLPSTEVSPLPQESPVLPAPPLVLSQDEPISPPPDEVVCTLESFPDPQTLPLLPVFAAVVSYESFLDPLPQPPLD